MKILRRLNLQEVEEQMKKLEKLHGMSFDDFEELLLTRKMDQKSVDEYFKWANLVHAYRGYMESGELDCVIEELYDFGLNELKAFTPKRLELLYSLSGLRAKSINDLAQKVHRNVKNVYQDLQVLKKLGFINLKKRKRNLIPEVLAEEITFLTQ